MEFLNGKNTAGGLGTVGDLMVAAASEASIGSTGTEDRTGFEPIEHPLEPPDEDRPVKCPILTPAVLDDAAESIRNHGIVCGTPRKKRVELPARKSDTDADCMKDLTYHPAVRRRHHQLQIISDLNPIFRVYNYKSA